MTALRTAMGWLSRSGGNALRSSPSVAGCISAPKTPCTTRMATTQPRLEDRPMATDEAVKPEAPTRNTMRCPKRSPSRPAVIRSAATASR